jgi:hypothetical protein
MHFEQLLNALPSGTWLLKDSLLIVSGPDGPQPVALIMPAALHTFPRVVEYLNSSEGVLYALLHPDPEIDELRTELKGVQHELDQAERRVQQLEDALAEELELHPILRDLLDWMRRAKITPRRDSAAAQRSTSRGGDSTPNSSVSPQSRRDDRRPSDRGPKARPRGIPSA